MPQLAIAPTIVTLIVVSPLRVKVLLLLIIESTVY
jgi:hypothetical protein